MQLNKMNTAVVTIAIDFDDVYDLTRPYIKDYADRHGSDFIEITDQKLSTNTNLTPCKEDWLYPKVEIFRIGGLLDEYDYVTYFDADCLIKPTCPPISQYQEFGCINAITCPESLYTSLDENPAEWIADEVGNDVSELTWINAGVIGIDGNLSIEIPDFSRWDDSPFGDQDIWNTWINEGKIDLAPIPWKFNRTNMFNYKHITKKEAEVLHYNGSPAYCRNNRVRDIKREMNEYISKEL